MRGIGMKSVKSFEDLFNIEKDLSVQLDECHYAGDIVLTEEELLNLGQYLKEFVLNHSPGRVRHTLLVFSVNIAFFYYDEQGFWQHFCSACGIDYDDCDTGAIGNIIEWTLEEKGLLYRKRRGPFRYVGAILEQTGITKRYIPVFARMIEEIEKDKSLSYILSLPYDKYAEHINGLYCSRYLKDYLLDESGREFFVQVGKVLGFLRDKLLDAGDISGIPGFHPGFWNEFFKYYNNILVPEKRSTCGYTLPKLMFDPERMQIYLYFSNDRYTVEDISIRGNIIREPDGTVRIILKNIRDFEQEYRGVYTDSRGNKQKWRIDGWNMPGDRQAVFHIRSGYISNCKNVPVGRCYLITAEQDANNTFQITNYFGTICIQSELFSVYEIFKAPKTETKRKVSIEWKKSPDMYFEGSRYALFFDSLPGLMVENSDLLADNSYIILFDDGKRLKRIRDYSTLSEIINETDGKPCYAGEIRVEALNRRHAAMFSTELQRLAFCVIPGADIELPHGIYSITEKVKFKSTSPYIKFPGCRRIPGTRGEYETQPATKVIECVIDTLYEQIKFSHPINRISILIDGKDDITYLDHSLKENEHYITVEAPAGTELSFGLISDNKFFLLIKDITFNSSEEFTFRFGSIITALKENKLSAGQFAVIMNGKVYPLGKGVIAYTQLMEDFRYIEKLHKNISLINTIDEEMAGKIAGLYDIYHGRGTAGLPEEYGYDPVYSTYFWVSKVLDGVPGVLMDREWINGIVSESENNKALLILKWVLNARKAVERCDTAKMKMLLQQYPEFDWIPSLDRWEKCIEAQYSELIMYSSEDNIIREWKDEITGHRKCAHRSRISVTGNGRVLTAAWEQYLKRNFSNSIRLLEVMNDGQNTVIRMLKKILVCVIYFRNLRIRPIFRTVSGEIQDSNLGTVINLYKNLGLLLTGKEMGKVTPVPEKTIDILPILTEDRELIKNLSSILANRFNQEYIYSYRNSNNWAEILVIYRLNKVYGGDWRYYRDRFNLFITEIPDSPEKKEILSDFY